MVDIETPESTFCHSKVRLEKVLWANIGECGRVKLNILLLSVRRGVCDTKDWFGITEICYIILGHAFLILSHFYASPTYDVIFAVAT